MGNQSDPIRVSDDFRLCRVGDWAHGGIWPYRNASFEEGYKVVWLALPTFTLIFLSYLFSPDPLSDECVDLAPYCSRVYETTHLSLVCFRNRDRRTCVFSAWHAEPI